MKSLGSRLRRTLGAPEPPALAPAPLERPGLSARLEASHALKRRMAHWARTPAVLRPLEEIAPGGRVVETPHGPTFVVEDRTPGNFNHGARIVGDAFEREVDADALVRLTRDPRLKAFELTKALFLDIEASGLEHGAGTYAFLVGLGWFEDAHFVMHQLFLREPNEEPALLHLLMEALERLPYLVSFNGKSYDSSVLQTRLVLNRFVSRRECDIKLRPHLDLLHLSKNLYKDLWENTKLQTLERQALGFERHGDVPGSVVPTLWYHFLRSGNPEPIAAVLEHNRLDVLSMATLADRLLADCAASHDEASDPRSLVNLGRLWLRRREPERALAATSASLDADLPNPWRRRALHQFAEAARKLGREELQRETLDALVEAFPDDPLARVRRAIVNERRSRDLDLALSDALAAQRLAPGAEIDKRVARLRRRGASSPGGAGALPCREQVP